MAKIYKIILFVLLLGFSAVSVNAATLSFSQSADSYSVGSTFSVGIYTGSSDQAMNAASGVVSFPSDKLEVVSLSKTGSIFSLWVQEPSFSNSGGTVSFEGIVLNPGFIGGSGKILTITFRAKAPGVANLSFTSGSVLANDGTGTNILTDLRTAVINIDSKSLPAPTPPAEETTSEGKAPTITSSTHPDQEKWYANSNPEFSWTLPLGVLEVRTLIGTSPKSIPTVSYDPPIGNKKIDALPDGTYYFHLQIRTSAGWSAVAHYRVNIDTTVPKPFSITFPHGTKGVQPQAAILFNTTDDLSGVSHYEVRVGSVLPSRADSPAVENPYLLPSQYPGTYIVMVTALDRAGNATSASADFTIEAIDAPVITSYPEEVESGDIIKIRGTTYPNSNVTILVKQEGKVVFEESSQSSSSGDFTFVVTKRFDSGVYTFTARVTDGQGARSQETAPLTIIINPKFLTSVMSFILSYLSLLILILLALAAIIGIGISMWYRLSRIIRRLRREGREAEKVLEKSFNLLRKDVKTHIARLKAVKDKRKLTEEEILFLEEFEKNLREAENIITKEIQDVSRDS